MSIQMVILLPALFSLMFFGMQAVLIYQGRTIALAAAQEGAREAAAENGSAAEGIATAMDFVNSSSAGLSNPVVGCARTATTATVSVTVTTLSVVPGWTPVITQSSEMPIERLTR